MTNTRTLKWTFMCGCCFKMTTPDVQVLERLSACAAHESLDLNEGLGAAKIASQEISKQLAEAENADGL